MEVSRDYISKLLGIIEEQKGVIQAQALIIKEQQLEISNLRNKVSKQEEIINKLVTEVKELRVKVLEMDDLRAENKELKEEVKKLKGQLSKNSNNSSKPPSSNGFKSHHYSKKKKSDNKVGGQEGHKGSTLNRSTEVDENVVYAPEICENCKYDLSEENLSGTQEGYRQEIDIVIKKVVKNHHLGFKICPICGLKSSGKYPHNIKSHLQYGNMIKSFASYLSIHQLIPYDRLSKVFSDIFKIKLSAGSLYNFNVKLSDSISENDTLEDIKDHLLKSDLIHADETGLYCENKRYWGYVFSNTKFTYLDINESRSKKALDEIGILNNYAGNLETDFYAMYRKYPNIRNYFCNAHLLRELTFIHEIEGKYWAKRFMTTLLKLKNLDRAQSNFISQRNNLVSSLKLIIKNNLDIETRLQEENLKNLEKERLKKGLKKKLGKKAQSPSKNLLDRLSKYIDGYLRFAYDIRIPFTNNQGERDFRFLKVQQKISGTFRTENGARNFLKIASVISTFKKQNLNVLEGLQDILLGKTIAFEHQ